MGSAQYPGRGWVHVFRHRQVPGSDRRQYWQVPASVGWQPVPQRQGCARLLAAPGHAPDNPDHN